MPGGRAEEDTALVTTQLLIRAMGESDPEVISAVFTAIGWDKPPALYQHYLAQQEEGRRLAWVAEWGGEFAGYVTLLWTSAYSPFADRQIPEVADLAVLPQHRRWNRAHSSASTTTPLSCLPARLDDGLLPGAGAQHGPVRAPPEGRSRRGQSSHRADPSARRTRASAVFRGGLPGGQVSRRTCAGRPSGAAGPSCPSCSLLP